MRERVEVLEERDSWDPPGFAEEEGDPMRRNVLAAATAAALLIVGFAAVSTKGSSGPQAPRVAGAPGLRHPSRPGTER